MRSAIAAAVASPLGVSVIVLLLPLVGGDASPTAEPGGFDSGLFDRDETWSRPFLDEGRFDYYCTIHTFMEGAVVVESGAPEASTPVHVTIQGNKYVPEELHIRPGTTVEWENEDSVPHSVTQLAGGERPEVGKRDFVVLGVLGAAAVIGLGVLFFQRRRKKQP